MPLPNPKINEKQSEFLGRCMADNIMKKEFPDKDKRAAVCYSRWRNQAKNEGDNQ